MRPGERPIQEALRLAAELLKLSENGEAETTDDGCRILMGVVRDCAYKIRALAERELRKYSNTGSGSEARRA